MGIDEKRLTDGLRHGEAAAQEEFLRQYAPTIFQLMVRMTGNALDAEELTQDTLLNAMRHIDRFDATRARLGTWLSRIGYRLALNSLRTHTAAVIPIDEASAAFSQTDETQIDSLFGQTDNEMTDWLLQAIEHLPPDEQTLITLFYYDALPLKEIAFIIDAPPGSIATRLHRIRKKLYHIILKLRQQ